MSLDIKYDSLRRGGVGWEGSFEKLISSIKIFCQLIKIRYKESLYNYFYSSDVTFQSYHECLKSK